MLLDTFNSLKGVTCVPATGALYLFPRFEFPAKMMKAAEAKSIEPDTFYALELLNSTGVVKLDQYALTHTYSLF
jgi:aspartate/methionine/tyrosine aminotransferase